MSTESGRPPFPDPDEPVEPAMLWRHAMERVCLLVEDAGAERMEQRVPACPDWTGRDLLAHMVGLGADVLDGDEPDDHNDAWTQAQVERRRDASAADLVAEWRGLADDLVAWMREHGHRPLNDVVIHEQDLRGALAQPGGAGTPEMALVRERMSQRLAAAAGDLPPLALVGESWSWTTTGVGVDEAETRLEASDLDLFRALTSRRTAEQLRSWTVRGDVTPYLDAFAGLGPLPDTPLPGE